ncbi:putative ABC transport system permease protein [Catalinimonas alkaloidigena]|uniref:Putative ABC transport system permease protein n=1 Tax=Catalinimonas alkaloidigena TaxID=1075417 RepID=A0A1G8YG61_9BACT|nr:ABC transporter permease [Catalinimonas alkaloidigena]SDK01050.1 putative ABC transport system permease protein [Catalinimonas alkaloidigena]
MFRNYLRVALRNLRKHRTFSFINLFGLAVSMSVCLLLIQIVNNQRKYDSFHEKGDRIYQVLAKPSPQNARSNTTPGPLAEALTQDYAVSERVTHLMTGFGGDALVGEPTTLRGLYADSSVFEVFSFELERGNPLTALREPRSIVLSAEAAALLFPGQDPMGKTFAFEDRHLHPLAVEDTEGESVPLGAFTVTGILKKTPRPSHLPMESLVSASTLASLEREGIRPSLLNDWRNFFQTYTYVLLREDQTPDQLQAALDGVAKRYLQPLSDLNEFQFSFRPLAEITPGHLYNNPISIALPIEAYYFLAFLAFLVMSAAALNYTNLTVARALTRAKEVGVRKVTGALRSHLFVQFMGEAVLTALLALVLAVALLNALKPAFTQLWFNQYLKLDLTAEWDVYGWFILFAVGVGILAGIFPALYLTRFQPIQVLRRFSAQRPGKLTLRKVLTVVQFSLSLVFIISTLLLRQQVQHFLHFAYGFNQNNVVNISLQGNDYERVRTALLKSPQVAEVSGSYYVPSTGFTSGLDVRGPGKTEFENLNDFAADARFFHNLEIPLVAGRLYDDAQPETAAHYALLNEQAVQHYGFASPEQALGAELVVRDMPEGAEERTLQVIGVLKDFQYGTLIEPIRPLIVQYRPALFRYAQVRLQGDALQSAIASLQAQWQEVDPVHPMKYHFYDEQLKINYGLLQDVTAIVGFFSFLAVVIACLGLLGIVTFTAETRVKEVGIRKVLGANVTQVVLLLSRGFLQLLGIAVLIATPLAYFANQLWLQNLANRVDIGAGILFLGICIMLLLGLLTVASQTWRVARANPVNSLKSE